MVRKLLMLHVLLLSAAMAFGAGQTESTSEADSDEVITISIAKLRRSPPEPNAPVLAAFEAETGVRFDYIHLERNNYNEMLGLQISAGEIPDLFLLDGNLLQYQQFVRQGVLAPFDRDMMREVAPTVASLQEPHWPFLTIDGDVYALQGEKPSNKYPLNAIWRDDWLDNVGIDSIPTTLAEAEEAFYAFANDDPDGNGRDDTYGLSLSGLDMIFGAVAGGHPWGPWPQYWQWVDRGGSLTFSAVLPEMKDALELLAKWYADGVLHPEYVLGENKGGDWAIPHDFLNDRIGFTGLAHAYHWQRPMYEGDTGGRVYREFVAANPDASFAFGPAVEGPEGYAGTWKYSEAVGAAGMWVMGSHVEAPLMRRVFEVSERLTTDFDFYLLAYHGIEGEHWQIHEPSGAVQRIGDATDVNERDRLGINLFAHGNPEFVVRKEPLLFEFSDEHATTPGIESELKTALPSEGTYRADLETLRDQYFTEIITGRRPVDDFDEFVEEFYRLGGQTLTDEANAWYEQVLASR
jgi:putative aldouronate transport system substrate-binding protein